MRAWVTVCVLLPAAMASASEYRIPAPGAARIEAPAITVQGNWEVAVSFDPDLCEISCMYRLRRDRFGRAPVADLLLPPAVSIRVFSDDESGPSTVVVDPARTREPGASAVLRPVEEGAALPAARGTRRPASSPTAALPALTPRLPQIRSVARLTPLPLRV